MDKQDLRNVAKNVKQNLKTAEQATEQGLSWMAKSGWALAMVLAGAAVIWWLS